MANFKTIFFGTKESDTDRNEITCVATKLGEIYIEIKNGDDYPIRFINLDKATAIKFAKTLRTNINKLNN